MKEEVDNTAKQSYRLALLYDFLVVKGGAEAVSLFIQNNVDSLELCVASVNGAIFDCKYKVRSILGGRWLESNSFVAKRSLLALYAFYLKARFVKSYELVIFSGSYAPFAARFRKGRCNIMYCHTPPRMFYDLAERYRASVPRLLRPLFDFIAQCYRKAFLRAVNQMDLIIANSRNVQLRIDKYWGRDSVVIYPPVNTSAFSWKKQGDYYLSTARVEDYKRVELIVSSFIVMPEKKLVVASGGTALNRCRELAKGADNIIFTDWLAPDQLVDLVGECIASIYLPQDEDFGMSPVESMAAGKPVIGVAEGGLMETIVDGETGLLIRANPDVNDVCEAVSQLTAERALTMRQACEKRAMLFDERNFLNSLTDIVESQLSTKREYEAA